MILSIIGFLLAIGIVIYGVFKKYNFIFMALIGSLIIALTSDMNVMEAFIGSEESFVTGMGGFIADYFIIFLLSAIFAKYMDMSGAAESIANNVLKITGEDKPYLILVAIYIIGAILTLGGISTFVVLFIVVPLARKLFKRLNIPWRLVMTPYFLGIGTFTVTALPGSPQVQNIIVSEALGTPLTAAPIVGIAAAITFILWALWRMRVELNGAIENGEEFEARYDTSEGDEDEDQPLPSLIMSVIPLLALILTIIIGSAMGVENVIYYGLVLAVVLSAILYHNYIPTHKDIINPGVQDSISTTILPASAVGFGTVLGASNGFNSFIEGIQSLPIPPLISLSLITFLIAYAIGTASGALGIVTQAFVPLYNLTGIHPELVHRMILIPAVNYGPHNNAVLTFYEVTGLDHSTTYGNFNIAVHGGILVSYIVAYIVGMLVY